MDDRLFELVAWEPFAAAGFRSVFLAAAAGVLVVGAAVAFGARADVSLAAVAAAHEAGEEEVAGVAAAAGDVLAALAQDRLGPGEAKFVDERLVDAVEEPVA